MHTSSWSLMLVLSATLCVSKPLGPPRHPHPHQLNGIPDWCYGEAAEHMHAAGRIHAACSAYGATTSTVATTISSSSSTTILSTSTQWTVAVSSSSSKTKSSPTSWTAAVSSSSSVTKSSPTPWTAAVSSSSSVTKSSPTQWTAAVSSSGSMTKSSPTPWSSTTSSYSTIHSSGTTIQAISTVATESAIASGSAKMPPTLPSPAQFKLDKGLKWSATYVGNISYTDDMQANKLDGDKCRTGQIGDKVIWSCGDMECNGDYSLCGFSGGPAFYGTEDVMVIDTTGVVSVNDNNFMLPWAGENPIPPQTTWGMDTSNVAPINDTHGVAFGFQIWRGAPDGSFANAGNAVASVTLGPTKPIASRVGPLLTGPDEIQLGHQGILRDGDYIYTYSMGGPSLVIVGRVPADDSVFDATKHEFLAHGSTTTWLSGIPMHTTQTIGATTANSNGQFGCASYGSVFFSQYLEQYVMVCGIDLSFVNMYLSPTPYGPWSAEYGLMSHTTDAYVLGSYGTMVHPEYGNSNEIYMSMGPNSKFNMFKITFNY